MISNTTSKEAKQRSKAKKMSSTNTMITPVQNPVPFVNWGDLGPPPPPPVLIRQTATDIRIFRVVRRRLVFDSDSDSDDEDENEITHTM